MNFQCELLLGTEDNRRMNNAYQCKSEHTENGMLNTIKTAVCNFSDFLLVL